ncbi:hypothetical protein ACCO45_003360 [Purpureocillium lilacinum]|uniref:Uncharacterized protein n=1 Tax=Purpureocillium lilacinum TaxID=33203 RepID=A0ACC4DZP3_PURLI
MKAIAIISALCIGLASATPARLLDQQCDNHLDCGGCLGQGDKSFTVVYSEAKAQTWRSEQDVVFLASGRQGEALEKALEMIKNGGKAH